MKTYNANIVATLARTARICAEEDELVDDVVDRAWEELARLRGAELVLDRTAFTALHPALRRRVLRRACAEVGPQVEVGSRHIDLALDAIGAGRRRLQLPGGLWLRIERDRLLIGRREARDEGRAEGGSAA
jgi:tRNA(Ile)-lysidine synthase